MMGSKKNKKGSCYYSCPFCGANLDPAEACDCQEAVQERTGYSVFILSQMAEYHEKGGAAS